MTRALRMVPSDPNAADTTVTMEEAIRDVTTVVVAARPSVMVFLWETPGADGVKMLSLPGSMSLTRGMVASAYRALFPEEFEAC